MANYLVLGAGENERGMGEAIAYDLLNSSNTCSVMVLDHKRGNLDGLEQRLQKNLSKNLSDKILNTGVADVSNHNLMKDYMSDFDAVVSAVPYYLNYELAKAAVEVGVNFCDLGGNNYIVEKEFSLDKEAKEKGIKIIPDCGIAPGAVSIIAASGMKRIGHPEYVRIRVGGIPQEPKGFWKYEPPFSVAGWFNECLMPTEIIKDYQRIEVDSMTDLEKIIFPEPFGEMEAAYTSGGSSTLTKTLAGGTIKDLDYKTIRWPGHWKKMQWLKKLGFLSEKEFLFKGSKIIPREVTKSLFNRFLPYKEKDVLLARIVVGGKLRFSKEKAEINFDLIDEFDEEIGHSAMQRTTGYSASIIAQMMVNGDIKDTGVLYQELSVSPLKFIMEWKKRNINIKSSLFVGS